MHVCAHASHLLNHKTQVSDSLIVNVEGPHSGPKDFHINGIHNRNLTPEMGEGGVVMREGGVVKREGGVVKREGGVVKSEGG